MMFYANKYEITSKEKFGRNVLYQAKGGEEFTFSEILTMKLELKCVDCQKFVELTLSAIQYHLKKEKQYKCQKCVKMGKDNPFFGKTHSKEFCDRLSFERKGTYHTGSFNHFYGKKHLPETIEVIREKCRIASSGENNPFFGKTHTEEACQSISEKNKLYYKNHPEARERSRTRLFKTFSKYRKTKPEKLVDQFLKEKNEKYVYSFRLENRQFDFVLKSKKILIEVHGDFWHAFPEFYDIEELTKVQKLKIDIDKEKQEIAKRHGYKLFIIWEHDVLNGNFEALNEI